MRSKLTFQLSTIEENLSGLPITCEFWTFPATILSLLILESWRELT